ncbi:hypothetical protein GCM10023405_30630 [Streptomonospora salina]
MKGAAVVVVVPDAAATRRVRRGAVSCSPAGDAELWEALVAVSMTGIVIHVT